MDPEAELRLAQEDVQRHMDVERGFRAELHGYEIYGRADRADQVRAALKVHAASMAAAARRLAVAAQAMAPAGAPETATAEPKGERAVRPRVTRRR